MKRCGINHVWQPRSDSPHNRTVCASLLHWCNLSILATVCHKRCSILFMIAPDCNLTDHNKSGRPILAEYKLWSFGKRNNREASATLTWVYAEIASLCFSNHIKKLWDGVQEHGRCHPRRWSTVLCEYCSVSDPRKELLSDLLRVTDGYRLWSYFLDITRWDRLQFFHSLSAAALVSGLCIVSWIETGLCTKTQWNLLPTYLFRRCGPHVVASLFSMPSEFSESDCCSLASMDVTIACSFPRLSFFSMQIKTTAESLSNFRRASTTTFKWSLSLANTLLIPLLWLAACNLVFLSTHYVTSFPFVSSKSEPNFRTPTVWSGTPLDLRESSNYPLKPFTKSCSSDLESCSPNPLVRKSDTLRFGP